tara:strand:- start:1 stop:222 length:222 start_codon:yes stop_codon:yes gene_type:complete
MKLQQELFNLQRMADQHLTNLPLSIRNNAEALEDCLWEIDDRLPTLNKLESFAAKVSLWTVYLFEAIDEGDLE